MRSARRHGPASCACGTRSWGSSLLARIGWLVVLTALPLSGQGAPAEVPPLRAAAHPFAGLVNSERADVPGGGAVVIGVAFDLPLASRLLISPSLAFGIPPGACPAVIPSNCPLRGAALDVSLLWQPIRTRGVWSLVVGPTVSRSSFDGVGGEIGGTASVGVLRGVGPRFTVHVLSRPGSPRQTRAMAVLSLRLGG